MKIVVLKNGKWPPDKGGNTIYLHIDNWDDYSFLTTFDLRVHDENGALHSIGSIKIAKLAQEKNVHTSELWDNNLEKLGDQFYSLGQGEDYYLSLMKLSKNCREEILKKLNDIVFNHSFIKRASDDLVFKDSILRSVSLASIEGQYTRIIKGQAKLTDFYFAYSFNSEYFDEEKSFKFNVEANSKPRTNIHAVIGRNGVGKTTFLNNILSSITTQFDKNYLYTLDDPIYDNYEAISKSYFSSLISVSYSAFDPFVPPKDRNDPSKGASYYYIGLKDVVNNSLKTPEIIREELVSSIKNCIASKAKLWGGTIKQLESDLNFSEKLFCSLLEIQNGIQLEIKIRESIITLSSGHLIVLLTISKIIEKIEEKTLILMDEPETHLHPPLLSAFIRALSNLLVEKNAVAILATHSPVVLQEIPCSCVNIFHRIHDAIEIYPPDKETFGENVGILTNTVFGLEVTESGFHSLLKRCVEDGMTYDEIMKEYNNQIGSEARKILQIMLFDREKKRD